MELKLTDEHLKAAISEAILASISQESRDLLLRQAMSDLLENRMTRGCRGYSPIEEKFAAAVGKLADDVINDVVRSDAVIRKMLEEAAKRVITASLASESLVRAFERAFVSALKGEDY